jgi:hypothetical protein
MTEPSALIRGIREEDRCSNISAIAVNILVEGKGRICVSYQFHHIRISRGSMLSHRYDDFDVCENIVLPSFIN